MTGASHGQSPKSQIQTHELADGTYVAVLWSRASSALEAGRHELEPEFKRICGSRLFNFGEHRFVPEGKNVLLMQGFRCVDAASGPPTTVTGRNWRPTALQRAIVLDLTLRYFDMKDKGDYEQVRDLLVPALPFQDWLAAAEKFNKQSGERRGGRIERVTWYKDMPNAFAPGIFAAVNFTAQFANIDIYCGYVIWHQGKDGPLRLLREEQNYISRERQQTMSGHELAAVRKKWGC